MEYPNYSNFKIIENLFDFIQNKFLNENKSDNSLNVIHKYKKEIKINTRNALIKRLNAKFKVEYITEIIVRKRYVNDKWNM